MSFFSNGAIAQLGERLLCKQEVVGSIPSGSTKPRVWCLDISMVRTIDLRRGGAWFHGGFFDRVKRVL